MAPSQNISSEALLENKDNKPKNLVVGQLSERKYEIVYHSLIVFVYLHLAGLYGLYLCFTTAKWPTIGLAILIYTAAILGVTAGAHRLWTHRSYKAKLPLQILLMIFNNFSFQHSVVNWARDHRLHHKYTDTDADPHNAKRGFFYSHIGWLLVRKHSEVKIKGKTINMKDIHSNPVLMFQKKYAFLFIGTFCFILPTLIPVYFWDEDLSTSWHVSIMRYVISLNVVFLVNSAAHLWGTKPYDKNIMASQNLAISLMNLGESFHNYHHTFPWDYRAGELGHNYLNLTAKFIDFFAWVGWAYDLKTVSDDVIMSRKARTGDGNGTWWWN